MFQLVFGREPGEAGQSLAQSEAPKKAWRRAPLQGGAGGLKTPGQHRSKAHLDQPGLAEPSPAAIHAAGPKVRSCTRAKNVMPRRGIFDASRGIKYC